MKKTIIIGTIEFLGRGEALIHSVEEVLQAGSQEELDALEDIPYSEGKDWVVVEDYKGNISVTRLCLLKLVGCIRGE